MRPLCSAVRQAEPCPVGRRGGAPSAQPLRPCHANMTLPSASARAWPASPARRVCWDGKPRPARAQDLDPALLSRFDAAISFGLPSEACRGQILRQYARHLPEADVAGLAAGAAGMSGRDLRDVAEQAERRWASKARAQPARLHEQGIWVLYPTLIYPTCSRHHAPRAPKARACPGRVRGCAPMGLRRACRRHQGAVVLHGGRQTAAVPGGRVIPNGKAAARRRSYAARCRRASCPAWTSTATRSRGARPSASCPAPSRSASEGGRRCGAGPRAAARPRLENELGGGVPQALAPSAGRARQRRDWSWLGVGCALDVLTTYDFGHRGARTRFLL